MAKKKSSGKGLLDKLGMKSVPGQRGIDYTFLFLIMLLLSIGLVMLLSASAPPGASKYNDSYYFFKKQLLFVVAGLVGMVVVSKIDYRIYRNYTTLFFGVCLILLLLVAIPGIGVSLNGSRRWLQLPGFQLQPSEFMKLGIAMFFADRIATGRYNVGKLKDFGYFAATLAIVAILMLLEPHLSGTIVIVGIGLWVLVASGTKVLPFIMGAPVVGVIGFVAIYFLDANRFARIMRFISPFEDMQHTGYQIAQALYAMGSGGLFGRGLGQSVQKYSYLPEPYNDFIFSVACEELGLFGGAIIIIIFALLILRGFRIALNAPDTFGTLLATGIMAQIAIQTTLNIAVATSSVPNTGVSLPFFSYGGTAILVILLEMGILLNISRASVNEHGRIGK
ncbi:MAG: putative lipid II flippase FtsW [Clostridia bacterium]|nr:putative lipid II flippase FtsW [Clostridia bacterium]